MTQIDEQLQFRGEDGKPLTLAMRAGEQVRFSFSTAPYGGSPSNVAVEVRDITDGATAVGTDVTAATVPDSPRFDVSGDTITTRPIIPQAAGRTLRLTVQFDAGGNRWRPFVPIVVLRY